MNASPTVVTEQDMSRKRLTLARVVAIIVIVLAAGALVALRFSGGETAVSVPRGAHAGQVFLHSCTYSTDDGSYPAECGTLVVPENRQDPASRLIALPVIRVRARSAHPGAPIFYMVGGPGLTNVTFPQASRFAGNHDVVLVGYRGVDGSVRLDCPEVTAALTGTSDLLSKKTLQAYSAAFRSCATRLTSDGVDLAGYNLVERVDDMDAARTALGYQKINLISESAGTRAAMIYAWRYPQSIDRSVMLGVNPPGHYVWDGTTTDAQIEHYSELCKRDATCRGRTADLANTMRNLAQHLPRRWLFLPIKPGNVRLATFYGLVYATSVTTPLTAPETIDTWLSAAAGDPSGMWLLSLLADFAVPASHVWGDLPATGQIDDPVAAAYYADGGDHGSILGNGFTDSLWGAGGVVNAWPQAPEVDQYRHLRPSSVNTLLISGDVDFETPAQIATKEFLPTLRHGHQVILPNLGHTEDVWNYEKPALNTLINTFLDSGRVDQSGFTPRAMSFHASPTHTMIAKIILGTLSGLAFISVALLVWLPLRLRRRGSVGKKTAIATRAMYAPVIGLGGWCLAVLVVLTLWPSLSLASEPLAVISVAVPVAASVYVAWVHRAWPRSMRNAGLGTVVAGAVAGAWLGLHEVDGLFSVITAVLGAVLGSNLAVLVRDVLGGTPAESSHRRSRRDSDDSTTSEPVDGAQREHLVAST
jgi:pimeloyl-ACP methyl ester carboxylesterase